jgi:phage terminase small subunit
VLAPTGALSELDWAMLAVLCDTYEQWQDAAARAGLQLGTANSIDGTVRLAEYNGQRGEARLVEAR